MNTATPGRDITRTTLALVVIGILIVSCFWVLSPFLPAIVWASMIVIATWPLMLGVQCRLRGRRSLAVLVMTLALLLILILPLSVALFTLADNIEEITDFARLIFANGLPQPPAWLESVPVIGHRINVFWVQTVATGRDEILAQVTPYIGAVTSWLIAQIGGVGMLFLHFFLTVIISAILYSNGETAARGLIACARRLAGDQGEQVAVLAALAIRAVALGVIITAVIQSVMAAIGFALAGVPYALILSSLVFLLGVIQVGAGPILIGVIIWLYVQGSTVAAVIFLIWAIVIMGIDNLIRPILIKRGANLPLLLVFTGVIGGLISFGIIGLFIGPAVLAVSYTLARAWINEGSGGSSHTTAAFKN